MITNLKPYPAYKDSGVEWLGQVPEHWEVAPIRAFARPGYKTFTDGDWIESPYIRDEGIRLIQTGNIGIGSYREQGFRYIDEETFKQFGCTEIQPRDILICRLAEPVGRACLAPDLGVRMITSVDVCILKPRSDVDPAFVVYALSYQGYLSWMNSICRGGTRNRVSRSMLGSIRIQKPPFDEQTAIVRFLDYIDRRIRRYIRAKQKLIKLLEEYKQALIHRAVTGQIDVRTGQPYPAYKPSGVEWLGQVPEHWVVRRLKRIARLNPSKSEVPLAMRNDPAVFLPMERVGSDGRFDASEVRPISALWNGFTYFRRGDVIVAKITPCFENGKGACLENLPTALGFGSTEFHVIRPSNAIVSAYLYRVTTLSEFRGLVADEMTGAAGQQRVPVEFIANFPIPLPPLPEQTAIVEYLDTQTTKIDAAIAATRSEIELLREYRTRLIADVVTGKVDVREVAARLPEEPPEEEAEWMDTDETAEGEATDEEAGTETVEEEEVEP